MQILNVLMTLGLVGIGLFVILLGIQFAGGILMFAVTGLYALYLWITNRFKNPKNID